MIQGHSYVMFMTNHHHHLVMPSAQISLTLSCHLSLSFIDSGFFSIRFVSVHVVHPYNSIDTTAA